MLAIAVAQYLDTNVAELTFRPDDHTGNLFVAHMPDTPDVAVMLMPTGGQPTDSAHPHDEPVLQVLTRGARHDHLGGYRLARAIYDQLVGLHGVVLDEGGPNEVSIIRTTAVQSDPAPLGPDGNKRPEWSQNFPFRIRAVTAHRA